MVVTDGYPSRVLGGNPWVVSKYFPGEFPYFGEKLF